MTENFLVVRKATQCKGQTRLTEIGHGVGEKEGQRWKGDSEKQSHHQKISENIKN